MKYVAYGIFSSYMLLLKIARKIEQIIRKEMDAIDGQEVQFPVAICSDCGFRANMEVHLCAVRTDDAAVREYAFG